ncbi:MAG TPA: porin family protein [Flavobacteriaceae bacterium]|nr:porin family protein [Flavobacteriaceae bacterium]
MLWNLRFVLFILFLLPLMANAQSLPSERREDVADSLYREDQFFVGITYNFLVNKPTDLKNRGLSGGIRGGYFRDMPLNLRRNVALAVGLGLAYDQFGHNFFVGEDDSGNTIFRILDENVGYDVNRFSMASVNIPVEFRWRTSTPTDYRFWRAYAGATIGYAYWYKASFKQLNNRVVQTKIPEFQPWRFSINMAVGYGTFNFYASYDLNPFFKASNKDEDLNIEFNAVRIGLMFYIL